MWTTWVLTTSKIFVWIFSERNSITYRKNIYEENTCFQTGQTTLLKYSRLHHDLVVMKSRFHEKIESSKTLIFGKEHSQLASELFISQSHGRIRMPIWALSEISYSWLWYRLLSRPCRHERCFQEKSVQRTKIRTSCRTVIVTVIANPYKITMNEFLVL